MTSERDFLHALDSHTVREEARLDRISEHLANISATQREQKVMLDEHMRRTVALEGLFSVLADRLSPLEGSAMAWSRLGKIVVSLGAVAGAVIGLIKALAFFHGGNP